MYHCCLVNISPLDQPIRTALNPSFPIGVVKTGSVFIVRLVETGLGRLVVAVISVDAYPFLAFSDLTLRI